MARLWSKSSILASENREHVARTRLTYGQASHQGLVRKQNQDSLGKFPRAHDDVHADGGVLFVVADGMGGHQGGREASQMAVHLVEKAFFGSTGTTRTRLGDALKHANARIYERAQAEEMLTGMGTTCSALHLHNNEAVLAHVGDSRIYRVEGDTMEQLTTDHRKIEELVQQLGITVEEAQKYTRKNALSRALGVRPEVKVDVAVTEARPGHMFVLCSDGLLDVPQPEILATLQQYDPQRAADLLVKQANDAGGKDNVTVQVIQLAHDDVPAAAAGDKSRSLWVVGVVLLVILLIVLATTLGGG